MSEAPCRRRRRRTRARARPHSSAPRGNASACCRRGGDGADGERPDLCSRVSEGVLVADDVLGRAPQRAAAPRVAAGLISSPAIAQAVARGCKILKRAVHPEWRGTRLSLRR
eukprot:scaffold1147_cov68-Phaeocystis_antarctica.AAC.15